MSRSIGGVLPVVVGLLVVTSAISATGVVAEPGVSEEEYVEEVPERGDSYFEAADPDGNWISYVNPRDEYRNPYLGDGSAKICVTLVNENGETVAGESVPNTTVMVPTGESIDWHSSANPMTVEYPVTENYERPLDADQFGTTSDLPQGDGYLDSHCIEVHGLPEDGTVEYGEAQIDGEHADQIEVVGYIQQAHEAWDTDTDPIDDAESYEEAGGGWTYETDASHGQVVVVLQLDAAEKTVPDDEDDEGTDDADAGDEPTDTTDEANESDEETDHDRDKDEGDVLQLDPPEETTSGDNTKDGAGPDDADAGDEPADITDEADANDEMDREKGEVNVMGNSDDDSILAFGVLVTVGMLFLTALARARLSRSPISRD